MNKFPKCDWKVDLADSDDEDENNEYEDEENEDESEDEGPLAKATEKEIQAAIAGLSLENLKAIDREFFNSTEKIKPKLSKLQDMTTFTVHKMEIKE